MIRPPAPFFGSWGVLLFTVMVALAVVTVLVARSIERSWIGRGLAALRDNEEAAECMGVPTLKLKLAAATVSGALMGIAGAPLPFYINFIEPASAFSLNYAVSALAMPIIGGTASWIGPVIGAVLLGSVQQVVTVTVSSVRATEKGVSATVASPIESACTNVSCVRSIRLSRTRR